MLRTGWPGRVDECVVQILLNVVNDPLLEIRGIVGEHSNAVDRFLNGRFVAPAHRLWKVSL